ncbi:hypothetical protein ACFQDN_21920 [Pseudomonas asuensis]|uniref:Uncharacterized protein n=1 Tax=Pseudomonas asuensis TaxID=1825787 RepID=A0ABQ2H2Z6_9PSED|nr:hypothetical protein [Pseudomonas asuensis]GGM25480.1 hypothetical protein GCM10009425_40290 [Pseudomonas asuensis]
MNNEIAMSPFKIWALVILGTVSSGAAFGLTSFLYRVSTEIINSNQPQYVAPYWMFILVGMLMWFAINYYFVHIVTKKTLE